MLSNRNLSKLSAAELAKLKDCKSINLHANCLQDISELYQLKFLKEIDLSSNQLESISGFGNFPYLIKLNLSNNKISSVGGLDACYSLKELNLSFNLIEKLDGFVEMHGPAYSLEKVDLRGNLIKEARQINFLAGCTRLKYIRLKEQKYSKKYNQMTLEQEYPDCVFRVLSFIESVDGYDVHGLVVDEFIQLDDDFSDWFSASTAGAVLAATPEPVNESLAATATVAPTVAATDTKIEEYMSTMVELLRKSQSKEPAKNELQTVKDTFNEQITHLLTANEKLKTETSQLNKRIKTLYQELMIERRNVQKLLKERSISDGQMKQVEQLLSEQQEFHESELLKKQELISKLVKQFEKLELNYKTLQNDYHQQQSNSEKADSTQISELKTLLKAQKEQMQMQSSSFELVKQEMRRQLDYLEVQLDKTSQLKEQIANSTRQQIEKLNNELAQEKQAHSIEINRILASKDAELQLKLKETSQEMEQIHQAQVDSLLDQMQQMKDAYRDLEMEFMSGIEKESSEKLLISQELTSIKNDNSTKVQLIDQLNSKIKEMSKIIHDLTSMNKDLKDQYSRKDDRVCELLESLENSRLQVDGLSKQNKQLNLVVEKLRIQTSAQQKVMNELKQQSNTLQLSLKTINLEFNSKEKQLVDIELELKERIDELIKNKKELVEKLASSNDQCVAQQHTIEQLEQSVKQLKQNLDNKTKEQQTSMHDLANREARLVEQLEIEESANEAFRQKLEQATVELESSLTSISKLVQERDSLKQQLLKVSDTLNERNSQLFSIEKQVSTVKSNFDRKLAQKENENERLVQEKNVLIQDLTLKLQNQSQRYASWDREREALIQSVKRLQKELAESKQETVALNAKVSGLESLVESEKNLAIEKMRKLKAAFLDMSIN